MGNLLTSASPYQDHYDYSDDEQNHTQDRDRAETQILIICTRGEDLFEFGIPSTSDVGKLKEQIQQRTDILDHDINLIMSENPSQYSIPLSDDEFLSNIATEGVLRLTLLNQKELTELQLKMKFEAVDSSFQYVQQQAESLFQQVIILVEKYNQNDGQKLDKENQEKLRKRHLELAEKLMAQLLVLDGIQTDDNEIRKERKQRVLSIQNFLDQIDASRTTLKIK